MLYKETPAASGGEIPLFLYRGIIENGTLAAPRALAAYTTAKFKILL